MSEHTADECKRLQEVRKDIHVWRYEASDTPIEYILKIFNLTVANMEEHEKTCAICSEFIKQDRVHRCAKYQELREAKWKWGKKYDDAH